MIRRYSRSDRVCILLLPDYPTESGIRYLRCGSEGIRWRYVYCRSSTGYPDGYYHDAGCLCIAVKRDFSAGPKTSWKEKWEATRQALPCIGLPIIVVGGIMGGFFTPTEAAAAAVLLFPDFVGICIPDRLAGKSSGNRLSTARSTVVRLC